jgi:hypothetical protein
MSEDNNNYEAFIQGLPEDIQALGMARDSTSAEQFWKRVSDNNTFAGQSIRIPSAEASTEDMNTFYGKLQSKVPNLIKTPSLDDQDSVTAVMQSLGMPSEADSYETVAGEGVQFAEGQQEGIKQLALKAGLTRAQYQVLAKAIGEDAYTASGEAANAQKESDTRLQNEWGLAAESKYQQAVNFAKSGGAPEGLINKLESRSADAETVLWLSGMANQIGESSNATSQANQNSQASTPYEAQEQIREILGNKEHGYHKGDPRSREKMHQLMRMAEPEKYA